MRAHKFQISTEGVYIYTEGMYKICMEGSSFIRKASTFVWKA